MAKEIAQKGGTEHMPWSKAQSSLSTTMWSSKNCQVEKPWWSLNTTRVALMASSTARLQQCCISRIKYLKLRPILQAKFHLEYPLASLKSSPHKKREMICRLGWLSCGRMHVLPVWGPGFDSHNMQNTKVWWLVEGGIVKEEVATQCVEESLYLVQIRAYLSKSPGGWWCRRHWSKVNPFWRV